MSDASTSAACPDCKTGTLIKKDGRRGSFFGCSEFPSCRHTISVEEELVMWLKTQDENSFAQSLVAQFNERGFLTPKQIAAATKTRDDVAGPSPNASISDQSIIESLPSYMREHSRRAALELERERLFQALPKGLLPMNIRNCDKCGCSLRLRFRKRVSLEEAICKAADVTSMGEKQKVVLEPFITLAQQYSALFCISIPSDASKLPGNAGHVLFRMPYDFWEAEGKGIGKAWQLGRPERVRQAKDLDDNAQDCIARWFSALAELFPERPDSQGKSSGERDVYLGDYYPERYDRSAADLVTKTTPEDVGQQHLEIVNALLDTLIRCEWAHFESQISDVVRCMRRSCGWSSFELFGGWPNRSIPGGDFVHPYHKSVLLSERIKVRLVRRNPRWGSYDPVASVTLENKFRWDLNSRWDDIAGGFGGPDKEKFDDDLFSVKLLFSDLAADISTVDLHDAQAFSTLKAIKEIDDYIEEMLRQEDEAESDYSDVARNALFLREHGVYPDEYHP